MRQDLFELVLQYILHYKHITKYKCKLMKLTHQNHKNTTNFKMLHFSEKYILKFGKSQIKSLLSLATTGFTANF